MRDCRGKGEVADYCKGYFGAFYAAAKDFARQSDDCLYEPRNRSVFVWRAEKIQSKTAKAGFDWDNAVSALGKLEEEVRELREAMESGRPAGSPHGVREELGDVLFMTSKIAQMSGVDPDYYI